MTVWRRFIVHRCRACMNDDDVHAKRNGKAVPLNSSRPKNGKASHTQLLIRDEVSLTDRTYGDLVYDF